MKYTFSELCESLKQDAESVYMVFRDFFGEDYVDFQEDSPVSFEESVQMALKNNGMDSTAEDGYTLVESQISCLKTYLSGRMSFVIYVWWPSVTVTNEFDKSINIQDLYAKIRVNTLGRIPFECGGFLLNRATYTKKQFASNYLHSHVMNIPKQNFSHFSSPCLGRGPIINTILTLKTDFNETMWMLFCQELNLYVSTESIAGVPWKRLENVGAKQEIDCYKKYTLTSRNSFTVFTNLFPPQLLRDFIAYYLDHSHLLLAYVEDHFSPALPCYRYIIDISNCFIEFYNSKLASMGINIDVLFSKGLLVKAIFSNGKFYSLGVNFTNDCSSYNDEYVLTFKGKDIKTSIIEDNDADKFPIVTLLNYSLAMIILKNILKTVNYRYKNEHDNSNQYLSTASSSCKKPYFI